MRTTSLPGRHSPLTADAALTALLKRDRVIVAVALAAITLLACAYVVWLTRQMAIPAPQSAMPGMSGMDMREAMQPALGSWTAAHTVFMIAMWTVMMVGMMTPSAAPMILIYTQVARQAVTLGKPFVSAGWFTGGYLLVWTAFAALSTAAQWALERAALLSPMMQSQSRVLGGVVLVAVGAFQWTPLKDACLSQCRAPLSFIQRHGGFKSDVYGSLRLGILHGAYCVGCCWALMALLFVGGVMNLLWIAAIAIFVLAEKFAPGGRYIARVAGVVVLAAGIWMLAAQYGP